ncbi:MAG: hypothetical protein ACTSU5_16770 [Promethearchaeota archaeon]
MEPGGAERPDRPDRPGKTDGPGRPEKVNGSSGGPGPGTGWTAKALIPAFVVTGAFYAAWWVVVYGILGHVCPFTFLGVLPFCFFGARVLGRSRPHWGTFVPSFLIAGGFWWAAWELHGEFPRRHVTPEPTVLLILAFATGLVAVTLLARRFPAENTVSERRERVLTTASTLLATAGLVAGLAYALVPGVRGLVGGDPGEVSDWFDTQFYGDDVYWLFYVLAVLGVVSGACWLVGVNLKGRPEAARALQAVGLVFLAFIVVGIPIAYRLVDAGGTGTPREAR